MRNEEVVKLVKGGFSNELIVKTINSRPSQFDLTADDLLNLKGNGVPNDIIEAMISRQGESTRSANAPAPPSAEDHSFWLHDGDNKIRLTLAQVTVDARTTALTAFGGAVNTFATLSEGGTAAAIRVTNRSPSFGELMTPPDFRVAELVCLVRLEVDSANKHRRVKVGKYGAYRGSQTGIPQSARIPVIFDKVGEATYKGQRQSLYSMRPETPLAPGEYAVVLSQRMLFFDFGID
jgi:hypothetical protein